MARPGRDRGVLHLEAADQRQLDGVTAAAIGDLDDLREALDGAADQPDAVALFADGDDVEAALFRGRHHLPGIAIVDIDDCRAVRRDQIVEQAPLGGEIGLDGRMIIEMIARQIGEGAGGDAHAVKPVLIESVRRCFQRQMRDALARQLIERAVQVDRIGRGQRTVGFALGRHNADGADTGGRQTERFPDLAREGGDRCLAAGAGDGGDDVAGWRG